MDIKTAQRQLISLITQHLNESIPVARILKYQPNKNGSVTGKFESLGRVFNFVFNDNDVRYKPAGNMDSALFSEYYLQRFDTVAKAPTTKSRALPKCTSKSYSCKGEKGVACITLTKSCKLGNTAIGDERSSKIKNLSKSLASVSNPEVAQAKIVEDQMALAVENGVKSEPKKAEKQPVKTEVKKKTKLIDENDPKKAAELGKVIKSWSKYYKEPIPNELKDNERVFDWMHDHYIRFSGSKELIDGQKHLTIEGNNGKTQSAMIYRESDNQGIYIEYLATAPWNLVKGDPNAEKGSGAKAIVEAVKLSQKKGYEGKVTLDALEDAEPFYKHLGFEKQEGKGVGKHYELSSEKAKELLKKYGQ